MGRHEDEKCICHFLSCMAGFGLLAITLPIGIVATLHWHWQVHAPLYDGWQTGTCAMNLTTIVTMAIRNCREDAPREQIGSWNAAYCAANPPTFLNAAFVTVVATTVRNKTLTATACCVEPSLVQLIPVGSSDFLETNADVRRLFLVLL